MSATIELTKQLVAIASVTPDDKNCQSLLAARLERLGFDVEHLPFGNVSNLWATIGESGPLLVFAGHTDVVPAEPVDHWTNNPFQPTERDGFLYGRGTADMKGSIAAMITAAERLLTQQPALKARLGFLITSDEEGQAIDGTRKVVELLQQRQQTIDYCVVGEPSCSEQLGDTMRIGRRGSLSCKLIVKGIGGHVAYPQLANNPIHKAVPALQQLISKQWDTGNQSFPATSFQISNIHSGVGANNVIPETLEVDFNLRYSTELTASAIQKDVENILQENGVDYECQWHLSGEPFLTETQLLIEKTSAAIEEVTGITPELSTGGGTSDGRFIAKLGGEVIEFGPGNASIHKIDECVKLEDLDKLSTIYERIMTAMLY